MASGGGAGADGRVKVRAQHILVKTEAQADELLARLEGGADFGELAMVESDCPSKQQGGDLGWCVSWAARTTWCIWIDGPIKALERMCDSHSHF